jgi:ADP-heptose:LPS heptosyltransferase
MGSGLAREAKLIGHRIAFGHSGRILWSKHAYPIFYHNQNVARPGDELRAFQPVFKWIEHYPGNRLYNKLDHAKTRWIWNYDFKAIPGELFLTPAEQKRAEIDAGSNFILIEPNVPMWKRSSWNKMWHGYQEVADRLKARELDVVQLVYQGMHTKLRGVRYLTSTNIRQAMAYLARARLFIGPEGGLHHAAAALNVPAIVLFGGFVPPAITGYDFHVNLTGGVEACGALDHCTHCKLAMRKITTDEVMAHAYQQIKYDEVCAL